MSETQGRVVSFVEKQLSIAQKRHAEMESSLAEVLSAIEDNARLQLNLHELMCDVMRAGELSSGIECLLQGLKHRFALKDVQIWGMPSAILPQAVPTEPMQLFLTHMAQYPCETGLAERFPTEVWGVAGVVTGCAFRLKGTGQPFGVLVLGRSDDGFDGDVDTLFLKQFVDIMGFWLEVMGGAGALAS
jgi:uncharacterized protein YigA (DUF484 family)